MKRNSFIVAFFTFLVILLFSVRSQAQNIPDLEKADSIQSANPTRVSVEQQPEFPGGPDAFLHYIARNLRYPMADAANKVQGKVTVAFMVDYDGSLTNIKIIDSVSIGINAEALRLIRSSPRWKPGTANGRPVRVNYTVPIIFVLKKQ
jgi:periplasmic protein TonB